VSRWRVAVIGGRRWQCRRSRCHLLRGERRAEAVEEGGDIDALPGGVGGYSGRAQVVSGVSCGSTEVNLMPSAFRPDSAAA